jgi:O-antigen/teichoic acid export membrane protein
VLNDRKKMSLRKNILKNGVASILLKLARVLEQLLLVPFFISSWGAAYYGEWLTLTIIPSVLAFSDLGFSSAVANSFVLKYVSGNRNEAANLSKTGFIIISLAIAGGIIISGIALTVIDQCNLLKNSLIAAGDAIWALSFLIAARLLTFYNQLFDAYFRAARKASAGINLLSLYSGLNIIVGFVVLWLGYGVVVFALSQLTVSILFNIFFAWKASTVLGLHKEYRGYYVKSEAKGIISKGFGYLMTPVWQVLFFQGTTFIVRLTLGPAAVAVFNTVRTLSRSVNHIYSIVNGSIFPEIQYEIGANNLGKARLIFASAIKIIFVLSIIGVIFLTIFGLPVYAIWTHNELNPPVAMWYLFLGGVLLNAIWGTAIVVFRAMNKPYQLAIAGIVSALLSIGCSYIFCSCWGLTGVAMGTLVFEIIMALYVLPVSCKLIELPLREIFRKL